MRGPGWLLAEAMPRRLALERSAPALLAALLDVEWGFGWSGDPLAACCPSCAGRKYRDEWEGPRHDGDCEIDVALTMAELPDQASRNLARSLIAAWRAGR